MTPDAPREPFEATRSPFLPQSLVDLFLRPRRFFTGEIALGRTPYVVLVMWCYGIASVIERIDLESVRAEVGRPRPGWQALAPWVAGSWWGYWAVALGFGALGGIGLWLLGGWWYRVRLRWCGAPEPERRLARLAYAYASFVLAAPTVLWALVETASYANRAAAVASDDLTGAILLVFPFWSLGTSFAAATTLFEVRRGRARLWFVILPALAYLVAYGALGVLAGLLFAFRNPPPG